MRSNRAGSPASFTHSNTSADAAGPRHGQSKGTRQALELVRGRSAADGALPVQLLWHRAVGVSAPSSRAEKPSRGRCRARTATDHCRDGAGAYPDGMRSRSPQRTGKSET